MLLLNLFGVNVVGFGICCSCFSTLAPGQNCRFEKQNFNEIILYVDLEGNLLKDYLLFTICGVQY